MVVCDRTPDYFSDTYAPSIVTSQRLLRNCRDCSRDASPSERCDAHASPHYLSASNSVLTSTHGFAAAIVGARRLGKPLCYTFGTINYCAVLLRFTCVLAITVDRFVTVMYPFRYSRHRTKVAAIIFIVGGLHSVVSPLVFDTNLVGCYNLDPSGLTCMPQISCKGIYCYAFIILQAFIILSFGIVTPMVLNIVMFYKAKKLRTSISCGTIGDIEMGGP